MADGELFAAMHDVGLAEFVAKGLDKKRAGRLASLGESRHTAFFLDLCERGITNIDDSNQTRCLNTPVTRTILAF